MIKSICRIWMCFLASLIVSVVIAKILGVQFYKPEPEVVVARDRTVITAPEKVTTPIYETEEEEEDDDYEPDENAYKRVVYIPEYIIIIEYTETEEELLAPPPLIEDFTPFETYVYAGERKPIPVSDSTQGIIYQISKEYDLPYRVVLALFGAETTWNEDPKHTETHGGAKYIGMGCINEKYHAEDLAKKGIDIYTLSGNIEGVCHILRAQYNRFGNITYAVMAYNGGAGYTLAQIEKGITENSYTRTVMRYAESFK